MEIQNLYVKIFVCVLHFDHMGHGKIASLNQGALHINKQSLSFLTTSTRFLLQKNINIQSLCYDLLPLQIFYYPFKF